MIDPVIDHVPFAWDTLAPIRAAARDVGLTPIDGGRHPDAGTEMALVPMADGSYVEFIAAVPGATPTYWPAQIRDAAGPADWCLRVPDVTSALRTIRTTDLATLDPALADVTVTVEGPETGRRTRPDGTPVAWTTGWLDGPPPAAALPFLIADRTPRHRRVPPPAPDAPAGIAEAVVAVTALSPADALCRAVFGLATPRSTERFDAPALTFPDAPLTLVAPSTGPVADRLARYGPGPCAVVLDVPDPAAFALTDPRPWAGGKNRSRIADLGPPRVRWFDAAPFERRLGVAVAD